MTLKDRKHNIRHVLMQYRDPSVEEQLLIEIVFRCANVTPDGEKAYRTWKGSRKLLCKKLKITPKQYRYSLKKLLDCGVIKIFNSKNKREHEYIVISRYLEPFTFE